MCLLVVAIYVQYIVASSLWIGTSFCYHVAPFLKSSSCQASLSSLAFYAWQNIPSFIPIVVVLTYPVGAPPHVGPQKQPYQYCNLSNTHP